MKYKEMTRKLVEDSEQFVSSASSILTTPGVSVNDIRHYLDKAKAKLAEALSKIDLERQQ